MKQEQWWEALEKPEQVQTQSFQAGNKPEKFNTCQLYWSPNRWMQLLGWGGGGNLNKLKNLEGKPRRQRVWKPDPARELNTTRMLAWETRESDGPWIQSRVGCQMEDTGGLLTFPEAEAGKKRSSVQPLQKLGARWEWRRWTKCWGSLRAQLKSGGDC